MEYGSGNGKNRRAIAQKGVINTMKQKMEGADFGGLKKALVTGAIGVASLLPNQEAFAQKKRYNEISNGTCH